MKSSLAIIAILSISALLLISLGAFNLKPEKSQENFENNQNENPKIENKENPELETSFNEKINQETFSSDGDISQDSNRENSEKPGNLENVCMLVRPGNLPDISCSVNYIKSDMVSLKIKNELGERINISIKLDSCNPEVSELVENFQEKDFVFSCSNKEYFNEAI